LLVFEFLAQAIGEKEEKFMSNTIKYSDGPIEEVEIVADFLPSPEELVYRDDTVKVTIALSRASVEFFKEQSQQHNVPYQRMIRRLLDEYARTYTVTP
jgi:predicted DNA binding CopG/RHH family protein